MTKSTITRERLEKIKSWRETYGTGSNVMLPAEEAEELACLALAAIDSEPVALQPELAKVIYHFRDWNEGFPVERFKADYVISWMLANYPPAQPAPERDQVRSAHAEWSQATFGNVGPVGPLKHLSKEALETAAEPGDLSEWADMQFLLWDAQRRAGITDEQITQAMIEKLAVNKQRKWPAPKDGEPRLHIKEQPAPVVQEVDADDNFYSWFGREWRENYQHNQYTTAAKQMLGVMAESAWKAGLRAAMLAAAPQPQNAPQNIPEIIPDCWCRTCRPVVLNDMRFVVCPDCGNKRCPRANDHRNACTGSNEPGQEGGAYPAAPKEVKGE